MDATIMIWIPLYYNLLGFLALQPPCRKGVQSDTLTIFNSTKAASFNARKACSLEIKNE